MGTKMVRGWGLSNPETSVRAKTQIIMVIILDQTNENCFEILLHLPITPLDAPARGYEMDPFDVAFRPSA